MGETTLKSIILGVIVAVVVLAGAIIVPSQIPSKGTGTCTQWINGKYHQVPCAAPPPQKGQPPGPSPEEIARAARREKAASAFKDGIAAMGRNDWQAAVALLMEAVRLDPENVEYKKSLERAETGLKIATTRQRLQADRAAAEGGSAVTRLSAFRESLTLETSATRLAALNEGLRAEGLRSDCRPSQDASVVDLCSSDQEVIDFEPPGDDLIHPHDLKIIKGMTALAEQRGWSALERKRLLKNLYEFNSDGETAGTLELVTTWKAVERRRIDSTLAQSIRNAVGVKLYRNGKQNFNDCAVYALASATGRPYSLIAAMATKNIREGKWRDPSERRNPELTIKKQKGGGLLNYEVVFLAESLGRAEVVSSADFEKTIQSGRAVMIGITFDNKSGHDVVLSKTFRHQGEPWFEMVDSNQVGFRRIYLSQSELAILLLEKGVAFSPDADTTPKLLR